MTVMAACIAVLSDAGGGIPSVPSTLRIDGVDVTLTLVGTYTVAGFKTWEYRWNRALGDALLVTKIAASAQGVVIVLWVPGANRADVATWVARVRASDITAMVVKRWNCEVDASGALTSTTLAADGTAVATAVKGAWPAAWKVWQAGDRPDPSDPNTASPTNPNAPNLGSPSGARCVGIAFA